MSMRDRMTRAVPNSLTGASTTSEADAPAPVRIGTVVVEHEALRRHCPMMPDSTMPAVLGS